METLTATFSCVSDDRKIMPIHFLHLHGSANRGAIFLPLGYSSYRLRYRADVKSEVWLQHSR